MWENGTGRQGSYELQAAATKKIDGDDIDDTNTDNAKAKIETSSSEELMQAMNDAMKSGDKTRAQALLKRWEASLL